MISTAPPSGESIERTDSRHSVSPSPRLLPITTTESAGRTLMADTPSSGCYSPGFWQTLKTATPELGVHHLQHDSATRVAHQQVPAVGGEDRQRCWRENGIR